MEYVRIVNVLDSKDGLVKQWQAPVLTATKLIVQTLQEEFDRHFIIVERQVKRLPKLDRSPRWSVWRNIIAQRVQKLELLAEAMEREMEWIEKFGNDLS